MFAIGQIILISTIRQLGPPLPISPWLLILATTGPEDFKRLLTLTLVVSIDPLSAPKLAPLFALTPIEVVVDERHPLYQLFCEADMEDNVCFPSHVLVYSSYRAIVP